MGGGITPLSETLGGGIFGGIIDPVGGIGSALGVFPEQQDFSQLSPAQQALLSEQIRLARVNDERQQEIFNRSIEDASRVRFGTPRLQSDLGDLSRRTGQLAGQFGDIGQARRGAEERILGSQLFTPAEVAGRSRLLGDQAALGGRDIAALSAQLLSPGGVTDGNRRLPSGFNVGAPLDPAQFEGAFTRGNPGFSPDIPQATTQPVINLTQDASGAFTRGSTSGPVPEATTNPVQAPTLSRSPVGNGLPLGFDGATTQPVGPLVQLPGGRPAPLAATQPSGAGLLGIESQGRGVGDIANTIQTELGNVRRDTLGTLGQAAQGQIPLAVQNLFTDAGGARERDILERQFANARAQTIERAGVQGGGLDRNLALLEGQRALGIADQEARRTNAQRELARNLFGVATQAGLGASGEEAALRGQAAGILQGGEALRQGSLQSSIAALDTALGRELQGQQAAIAGLGQSQALAQQLAGQIGQNADQFLFAQPGLFGQQGSFLQNAVTAPGLSTSLLQGLPINSPAQFLSPAQQTLAQQQATAAQLQAANNAGFGQLLGTAGIGALALFT